MDQTYERYITPASAPALNVAMLVFRTLKDIYIQINKARINSTIKIDIWGL